MLVLSVFLNLKPTVRTLLAGAARISNNFIITYLGFNLHTCLSLFPRWETSTVELPLQPLHYVPVLAINLNIATVRDGADPDIATPTNYRSAQL